MASLHEARFYDHLAGDAVRCTLCPHRCQIREGGRGACAVRFNDRGTLHTLVYDRAVSLHVDPVEKKPLFHFFPGSRAYSLGAVGCNMRCAYCQNWVTSQWPRNILPRDLADGADLEPIAPVRPRLAALARAIPGLPVTPRAIVDLARTLGCRSIAYTYTEPTIFYELAHDTALLAREAGLRNIFVTNGFISEAPLRELAPLLDAVNVDLKFFRADSYRKISRARLDAVLAAIRLYRELGVWIEVTTLVVPGVNDSEDELRAIAAFVRSVGAEVPWHVSRFYPAFEMIDRPATPRTTLQRAAELGREAGLRHVYQGNLPGVDEDTSCHACHATLVARSAHEVLNRTTEDGRCPDCGTAVDGVGMPAGRAAVIPTTRARHADASLPGG